MNKIVNDTLKNPQTGRWSRKSLTIFVAFFSALIYEFVFPYFEINTKEYVFITLMSAVVSGLGLTVWDKK